MKESKDENNRGPFRNGEDRVNILAADVTKVSCTDIYHSIEGREHYNATGSTKDTSRERKKNQPLTNTPNTEIQQHET